MTKTNRIIFIALAAVVALALSLGLGLGLRAQTALADELEAIDGADVKIVTRFEDSPEVPKCEITFANGRYLHLNPDTNVPVVDDDSAGADMEFYDGVLTIFYNDDVEAYHHKGLELWALNTTPKKFTLAVSEYLWFYAFDYPNGDLTVTTADGVTESTTVSIPHSIRVSGTLTVAGYASLSVDRFLGIHTNEDYVTTLEAYRLRLVDNATVEAYADEERHAIKVTHLSLDTEGSLIATVWTQDCISALKVDAEEIDLVKCHEIRIRSYTKHGDLTTLTNVPYLRNSADEPLPGWHSELQQVTDGLRLILVPESALHTVSFDPGDGEGEMEPKVAYYTYYPPSGSDFTPPAGMRLAGWSFEKNGEKVTSFELTEDVTLYALWETTIARRTDVIYGFVTSPSRTNPTTEYDTTTGVLTLDKDINVDISVGLSGAAATRQDITIRFVGQHNYGINSPDNHFCIWARTGDVTLEAYGEEPITVYLAAVRSDYSLTIKGNLNVVVTGGLRLENDSMTNYSWAALFPSERSYGLVHAGDTFSILDDCSLTAIDPDINEQCQRNCSLLTAKYMIFDTTGEVRVGTTTDVYNSDIHTAICVWDTEASKTAQIYDRITIRRCGEDGCLKLYRYKGDSDYLFFANTPVDTATLYYSYSQDADNLHYLNQTTDYTEGGVNAQLLTLKPVYVDFDANGGAGEMARDYARFDEDYVLPECAFEAPEGLTWAGWSVEGGELVSSDTTFHVESDMDSVTVTAMWACTVTYRANDGSGESVGIHNVVLGEYPLLSAEELGFNPPQGKHFAGWAYSAQGEVIETPSITLSDNVDLYAVWAVDTADPLQGSLSVSGDLRYGQTLLASLVGSNNTGTLTYQWRRNGTAIDGANQAGYTLVAEDIGATISLAVGSSVETGRLTWTAAGAVGKAEGPQAPNTLVAAACTTDLNDDGAIYGVNDSMEYKASDASEWIPCAGASLTGLHAGVYDVRVKETATHMAGQFAAVVVGAYDAPTQFAVTVRHGTANKTIAEEGDVIVITAAEPEAGYEFDCWQSDDVTFANADSTATTFVMPAKGVIVTATYHPVTCNVIFTVDGSNEQIEYGSTFILPAYDEQPPQGKVFGGWRVGDRLVQPGEQILVDGDLTISPVWNDAPVDPDPQPVAPQDEGGNKGLSGGAIAGIVIGCILGGCLLGCGIFALVWFVIKKKSFADFIALFKKK